MADQFEIPNKEQLKTEFTNLDLAMNYAIDGMTVCNCGFKYQYATHVDTAKQHEGIAGQPSSVVVIGQFCFRIIIIER